MPVSLGRSSEPTRAAGIEPAARPDGDSLDVEHARPLLANLGFLLVPGPPLDHGAAYLLVALRPRPTFAHFDPERIMYWSRESGRSSPAELIWPLVRSKVEYSWGTIRVADRIKAANEFVSFGGTLFTSRDGELHAALFRSDVPILALPGHSGPADPLGAQVAAFLARLRGSAGYDSPVHTLAETLSPVALYAGFLTHAVDKYGQSLAAEAISAHVVSLLRSERQRLEITNPRDAAAGRQLAALMNERSV